MEVVASQDDLYTVDQATSTPLTLNKSDSTTPIQVLEMSNLSLEVALLIEHMKNTTKMQLESQVAINENLDIFFLLMMGMMVFLMQPGFAFLEAGAVRSKNATNILIKNLLDFCITAVVYWAVGYAFAYGEPSNAVIGHNYFFGYGLSASRYHHLFFQFTFAATGSTIVSGALAERCEFVAYFVYSVAISGWIYPVLTHWAWAPNGWLLNIGGQNGGFQDFAGSGIVHLCGGTVSLVGAKIIGPRIGRFPKNGESVDLSLKGHSVPFTCLGTFILAFGFLAFNGGSQGSILKPGDGLAVATAMFNTILAGSTAGLTVLLIQKVCHKHWSLLLTSNGCLAGMVAICAGCNVVYPWAAAAIGVVAGVAYLFWLFVIVKLKIDDPLDAFPVHFGGGLWGLIAAPVFDSNNGILYYWNRRAFMGLAWNLVGAVAIIAWAGTFAMLTFGTLKALKCLRVSEEVETKGLDVHKHKEPAYPIHAYGDGWEQNSDILTKIAFNGNIGNGSLHAPTISHSPSTPMMAYDQRLLQRKSSAMSNNFTTNTPSAGQQGRYLENIVYPAVNL